MLDEELSSWLVTCGELVTTITRVLKECSSVCAEYSLKYLLLLTSLEFKRLCNYIESRFGKCYDVVYGVCGDGLANDLSKLLKIYEALAKGVYVDIDELLELATKLPELYVCSSRSVFELRRSYSSRSS